MVAAFSWPVRIYYEDTDAGGLVYYANYLRFMERARTELLRRCGCEQDVLLNEQNTLFAVRSVKVDYLRPAGFNDLLSVTAKVVALRRVSVTFEQQVLRPSSDPSSDAGPRVMCEGRIKVACLDARSLRPRAIPLPLQEAFQLEE